MATSTECPFLRGPSRSLTRKFLGQQLSGLIGPERLGKQVSLRLLALKSDECLRLLIGLYTLCDDPDAQIPGERNHCLDDGGFLARHTYPIDERTIDLQRVDVEPVEIGEG